MQVRRDGRQITLRSDVHKGVEAVELRIESDRNESLTRFSEDSPLKPASNPTRNQKVQGREIWFPIVDVQLEPGMEAVAEIDSPDGVYAFNPYFAPGTAPLEPVLVFGERIEYWENDLFIGSETASVSRFYLRQRLEPEAGALTATLTTLSDVWGGRLALYAPDGACIDEVVLPQDSSPTLETASPPDTLDRATLIDGLKTTIAFLLRSRNANPASPTHNGLYLFYDCDAQTFRRPDWVWSWGPAIRLLLEAAQVPELADAFGQQELVQAARQMGETVLGFQNLDAGSPAYGLFFCRNDPSVKEPDGYANYMSPADSLFLAGWSLGPLYEQTGDTRFLEALALLVRQMDRILDLDEVVEQDYVPKYGLWKDWTLDESGFGMEGFAELARVAHKEEAQRIGRRYIETMLKFFQREDGLWQRVVCRNDPERYDNWYPDVPAYERLILENTEHTRGLGWAMEGLLASHRLLPEGRYLDLATQMAAHLAEAQRDEGHWTFLFDFSADHVGISGKGTALWCLLFYMLHEHTRDPAHLATARRALRWCLAQRIIGGDPDALGGIAESNPASGVVYRKWFRTITSYTLSFFGLALLKELAEQE